MDPVAHDRERGPIRRPGRPAPRPRV